METRKTVCRVKERGEKEKRKEEDSRGLIFEVS